MWFIRNWDIKIHRLSLNSKMWGQERTIKTGNFRIYVVKSIDGVVHIEETFTTGIREFVCVPINEAKRTIERKIKKGEDNGYYMATDDESVATQYNLRLFGTKYK